MRKLLGLLLVMVLLVIVGCNKQETMVKPEVSEEKSTVSGEGGSISKDLPLKIDSYDFVSGNTGGSWQQIAVAS